MLWMKIKCYFSLSVMLVYEISTIGYLDNKNKLKAYYVVIFVLKMRPVKYIIEDFKFLNIRRKKEKIRNMGKKY